MAETETARYRQLRAWARSLTDKLSPVVQVCSMCSMRIAFAIVEREAGHPKLDMAMSCCRKQAHPTCDEIVRAHWDEKPPKVRP